LFERRVGQFSKPKNLKRSPNGAASGGDIGKYR
jgi:hypothetical protein